MLKHSRTLDSGSIRKGYIHIYTAMFTPVSLYSHLLVIRIMYSLWVLNILYVPWYLLFNRQFTQFIFLGYCLVLYSIEGAVFKTNNT